MEIKSVKSFREYLKEYVIIGLVVAVITLFKLYYNLNDYVINTLTEMNTRSEIIIDHNTNALQLLKR